MHDCTSEEVLKNHLERCKLHGLQRIEFPEADDKKGPDKIKFTKTEYQLRLPFVICMNFESVLHKKDLCEPSSSQSFTKQYQYQHHVPCGGCIYVKCSDGRYAEPPQVNMGDDTVEVFEPGPSCSNICRQHLANTIPMELLTQEQWRE